jgi:hypothetical protein
MIRFNRQKNKFYFDHSELLADPAIHGIIGKPRARSRVRSQQPTPAAPAAPAMPAPIEDPLTKFRRLVQELVLRGIDYASAVQMIDEEFPDLRERSVELARYRSTVAANHRKAKAAQWRIEVQRRFNARKAGR